MLEIVDDFDGTCRRERRTKIKAKEINRARKRGQISSESGRPTTEAHGRAQITQRLIPPYYPLDGTWRSVNETLGAAPVGHTDEEPVHAVSRVALSKR